MAPPIPLPVGWHLLARISCPFGDHWMHFEPGDDFERDMYCPNKGCPNHNIVYRVALKLDGVQIMAVK